MLIYHILLKQTWEEAKKERTYSPPSLEKDGFIHASTIKQILPTANRKFLGKTNLMILVIDTLKLPNVKIIFEHSKGSREKHPHIFGKLTLEAVKKTYQLDLDNSGKFTRLPFSS